MTRKFDPFNHNVGEVVFVKSITNYFIGKVVAVKETEDDEPDMVCLWPAAWLADQGVRQSVFLNSGPTNATEVERYETPVWIRWDVCTEITPWAHPIPESNNLSEEELKEVLDRRPEYEQMFKEPESWYSVLNQGSRVFVKTVTNFFVGDIADMDVNQRGSMSKIMLAPGSAWIADQGFRQSRFLRRGVKLSDLTEVERYDRDVVLNAYMITEIVPWLHAIPETNEPQAQAPIEDEVPEDDDSVGVAQDDGTPRAWLQGREGTPPNEGSGEDIPF